MAFSGAVREMTITLTLSAPNWDLMCPTTGSVVGGPGAFAVCQQSFGLALRKGLLNVLYARWAAAADWFSLTNVAVSGASSTANGATSGSRYSASFAMAVNCDDSRTTPVARAGVDAPYPCADSRVRKPVPTYQTEPSTASSVGMSLTLRFVAVHCVKFPDDGVCTGTSSSPNLYNTISLGNAFIMATNMLNAALSTNGGAEFMAAMRPAIAILQSSMPAGVVPMGAAGADGTGSASEPDVSLSEEAQVYPPLEEMQAQADAAAAAAAAASRAQDADATGLSTGAVAGIAVGAALAVAVLVAGVIVARRTRDGRSQLNATSPSPSPFSGPSGSAGSTAGSFPGTNLNAAFSVAGATAGENGRPWSSRHAAATHTLSPALIRNASAGRRPGALTGSPAASASGMPSRSGNALASPAHALAAYRAAGAASVGAAGAGASGAGRRSFLAPKRTSLASSIVLANDGTDGGASASV